MNIFLEYPIIFPLLSYLFGSIPFGLLFSKVKGKDPRKFGSGNIGATNISRLLGKKWGIITLLCDLLKGFLPVFFVSTIPLSNFYIAVTGLMAVVGHCYPVYLKFRGGKGVATALGVYLAICPLALAFGAIVFFAVAYFFRIVSVSSLAAATSLPLLISLICPDRFFEAMSWSICFIIWIRHSDNLKRLSRGEEKRISFGSRGT